jgi:hypothetical protein
MILGMSPIFVCTLCASAMEIIRSRYCSEQAAQDRGLLRQSMYDVFGAFLAQREHQCDEGNNNNLLLKDTSCMTMILFVSSNCSSRLFPTESTDISASPSTTLGKSKLLSGLRG